MHRPSKPSLCTFSVIIKYCAVQEKNISVAALFSCSSMLRPQSHGRPTIRVDEKKQERPGEAGMWGLLIWLIISRVRINHLGIVFLGWLCSVIRGRQVTCHQTSVAESHFVCYLFLFFLGEGRWGPCPFSSSIEWTFIIILLQRLTPSKGISVPID